MKTEKIKYITLYLQMKMQLNLQTKSFTHSHQLMDKFNAKNLISSWIDAINHDVAFCFQNTANIRILQAV